MSKRDDLIAVYTQDLKEKCGEANPDVEFLTKVTVGLTETNIVRWYIIY